MSENKRTKIHNHLSKQSLNKLTKEELAEEILDLLGVSTLESLTRMTKEDILSLHQALQDLKATSKDILNKPLEDILDKTISGKRIRDMTLGEFAEIMRDEGPLGLGILPELRRVWRDEIRPELRRLWRGERGRRGSS